MMIWNKKWECALRKDIKEIQLKRLQDTVKTVYDNLHIIESLLIL